MAVYIWPHWLIILNEEIKINNNLTAGRKRGRPLMTTPPSDNFLFFTYMLLVNCRPGKSSSPFWTGSPCGCRFRLKGFWPRCLLARPDRRWKSWLPKKWTSISRLYWRISIWSMPTIPSNCTSRPKIWLRQGLFFKTLNSEWKRGKWLRLPFTNWYYSLLYNTLHIIGSFWTRSRLPSSNRGFF